MRKQLDNRAVLTIILGASLVVALAAGNAFPQEKQAKNPTLIKKIEPAYPAEAKEAGTEGTVVLEIRIDAKGKVEAVKVLRGSAEILNKAAADAVKQWEYEPMIIDGKAQAVLATVTVRFALGDKKSDVATLDSVGTEKDAKPPIHAIGDIKPPKLVTMVEPIYPEEARKAGISGVVIVEATTNKEGRVVDTKVLRSIPELNQAAIDAVKQWVYEPMIIDGEARGVVFTVTVRFNLK